MAIDTDHDSDYLPVLCHYLKFTQDAVEIGPSDKVDQRRPTCTVPKTLVYIQPLSNHHDTCRVGECSDALCLTGPQQADMVDALPVIVWIPRWKCRELNLTPMGPKQ